LAIAQDTRRTLSDTVADLVRRGRRFGNTGAVSRDHSTGLPLVSVGTVVTSEDVRSLEESKFYALGAAPCSRSRSPLARTARRSIAARTEVSEPTTRTLFFARVTAV
jgi:hypothetical protein